MRFGGPDAYDGWTTHRIPFDNPAVREAGAYFEQLVFGPGFVRNGPESISTTGFEDSLLPMLRRNEADEQEPECWLYLQSDTAFLFAPPNIDLGNELGVFVLPPAVAGEVVGITGGSSYVSAYSDTPEVRYFMQWLSSPEYGEVRAAVAEVGNFVPANVRFDLDAYARSPIRTPAEISLSLELAATVRDAVAAGRFRVDGSDAMPLRIGLYDDLGPGEFFRGMLDFADGTRTMEDVLADIEAAWVALEANAA
jgi:alpha-glucoside transport system substrate-binding protein